MRGLRGLAEQRDFVDGVVLAALAGLVLGAHQQRMDDSDLRGGEPLVQPLGGVIVHEEADRAAMHAVDRLAGGHELVQGLQHQTVATERDDHISRFRIAIAVELLEPVIRVARLRRR